MLQDIGEIDLVDRSLSPEVSMEPMKAERRLSTVESFEVHLGTKIDPLNAFHAGQKRPMSLSTKPPTPKVCFYKYVEKIISNEHNLY